MTDHAAYVSAGAAILGFLFSIFVFFRTRWLHKKTERPMLVPGTLGYSSSEIFIGLKNSGGHPAKDLRIKYGIGPLSSPEQYRLVKDRTFVNKIGIGGETTISLQRGAEADTLLHFQLEYKDAFSGKLLNDDLWLVFNLETGKLYEPENEVVKIFLPYIT